MTNSTPYRFFIYLEDSILMQLRHSIGYLTDSILTFFTLVGYFFLFDDELYPGQILLDF